MFQLEFAMRFLATGIVQPVVVSGAMLERLRDKSLSINVLDVLVVMAPFPAREF